MLSEGCLEDFQRLSKGFLENFKRPFRDFLEDFQKHSRNFLEGFWMYVSRSFRLPGSIHYLLGSTNHQMVPAKATRHTELNQSSCLLSRPEYPRFNISRKIFPETNHLTMDIWKMCTWRTNTYRTPEHGRRQLEVDSWTNHTWSTKTWRMNAYRTRG